MQIKNPIIYKTTNLVNGKIYIGQDFHNKPKYLGSGVRLRSAIKHYGKEQFKKEILEYCVLELLNEREQYWIKELDSMNPEIGYNLTSGGHQNSVVSENTKEKLRNRIVSEITKEKLKNVNLGKKQSKETCNKRSKSLKGRKSPMKDKVMTNEHKNNISISLKGRKRGSPSKETRKRISNTLKNKKYEKSEFIYASVSTN